MQPSPSYSYKMARASRAAVHTTSVIGYNNTHLDLKAIAFVDVFNEMCGPINFNGQGILLTEKVNAVVPDLWACSMARAYVAIRVQPHHSVII